VAAVFDRPETVAAELFGPGQQAQMIDGRGSDGAFAEFAPGFIDRNDGVAALVRVDAENHHARVSCLSPVGGDRTGRRAHLSGGDATLLSSHAGRSD